MMVTREYKREQKELLKKLMAELKEKAKEVKKVNRKICRAAADAMNHRYFCTEWFSITSFEKTVRSFYMGSIKGQEISKELFSECMEKVINPLLELAKKVGKQQHYVYSLSTFPMSEKDSCYIICADIFKTWKPTEAKHGCLYVNGHKAGKSAEVGVIIGSGKRIHKMLAIAGVNDEHEDCVMVCNNTQWRNSGLLIVDLAEKMPEEAFSLV